MSDYEKRRNQHYIDSWNRMHTSPAEIGRDENARLLRIIGIKQDMLARNPGLSPEEVSTKAENYWDDLVSEDQRRPFVEAARDKRRMEETVEKIRKVHCKVINASDIVIPENGPAVRVGDFPCGANPKHHYLTEESAGKLVLGLYARKRVMFDGNETALIEYLRGCLLDGRTTYTVDCPECRNPSSYFRLVSVPKKD